MKIYTVGEILNDLENCIENNLPFSHIRFGDGGIKFIESVLRNDREQLTIIIKKEGLPSHKIVEIFELWGYHARNANYIDSPEVYYNGTFWPRVKKKGKPINSETELKLREWDKLYHDAEFDNEHYCNPESNYLMVLRTQKFKNILDMMKGRKVCIITVFPEVKKLLKEYDVDIVKIVAHYENQYKNSFKNVIDTIKYQANEYDFWLVAAGELGRIYSGFIKECGGRTIDIGFIIEYWLEGYIHPRLHPFMQPNTDNHLELVLTEEGEKYLEHI
jgi:hypothetical protein